MHRHKGINSCQVSKPKIIKISAGRNSSFFLVEEVDMYISSLVMVQNTYYNASDTAVLNMPLWITLLACLLTAQTKVNNGH